VKKEKNMLQNKNKIENPESLEYNKVIELLDTRKEGLTSLEAKNRLSQFGPNQLPEQDRINYLFLYFNQFKSFLILILIFAAIISFFLNHASDGYIILLVILANSIIGFFQEYKAEQSIQALKEMVQPTAKVIRDGYPLIIPSKEIVIGDILELEEGDRIAADARIFYAKNFQTIESSLTGESLPIAKNSAKIEPNLTLADRKNMVYMGTLVSTGVAKAVVVATGNKTQFGNIANILGKINTKQNHFKTKTDTLAKQLAVISIASSSLIFIVGYFIQGRNLLEMFLITTAILVSAIPEGLPAILSVVLSAGAKKMANNNAIVRDLQSTESFGVVNIICTDKTGTITENTMTVQSIFLPNTGILKVTGQGWSSKGNIEQNSLQYPITNNTCLEDLLFVCALGNKALVTKKSIIEGVEYNVIGDPTEAGLFVLAQKAGIKREDLEKEWLVKDDLMFTSAVKYRATLVENIFDKSENLLLVTGAPEVIFERSSNFYNEKGEIIKKTETLEDKLSSALNQFTSQGFRTIALAIKKMPEENSEIDSKLDIERLTFLGVVGIQDPVRPEVKNSITLAKAAGIKVMMLTGDHKQTATAIAKEIGLIPNDTAENLDFKTEQAYLNNSPLVLEEKEFLRLSPELQEKALDSLLVLARLNPETKLIITEILQKKGNIVAMTGDGVNDAPALKKADIGISMGKIGTDVARESSKVVLADDNFSSIILAIKEGRNIFQNIRKVSYYLLSTSLAEIAILLSSFLFGIGGMFSATQILWLNLVTDGINGIALAVNPANSNLMKKPPNKIDDEILNKNVIPFILLTVFTMLPATFIAYFSFLNQGQLIATSAAFFVISMSQIFSLLNIKSLESTFFQKSSLNNPFLILSTLSSALLIIFIPTTPFASVLKLVPFSLTDTLYLIFLSSLVLWTVEIYKWRKSQKLIGI
jgi:Ca2+-transporting ATPase